MQTTSILRARILYERVVTNFPTSGRYWRLYVEQEVKCAWNVRLTLSLHETFIVPKLLAHFNVVRIPCSSDSSVLVRCVLIRKGYLLAKSKCKVQFEMESKFVHVKGCLHECGVHDLEFSHAMVAMYFNFICTTA